MEAAMVKNKKPIGIEDIIAHRNIRKCFGNFHVLRGIATTIKRADSIAFISDPVND